MRFKKPGGDLNWFTPLLVLGGAFLAYDYFRQDQLIVAILFAILALLSALIWFDQRWAAWPLIAYFSVTIVLGSLALALLGKFTWLLLVKLLSSGFFTWELIKWARAPREDDDTRRSSRPGDTFEI